MIRGPNKFTNRSKSCFEPPFFVLEELLLSIKSLLRTTNKPVAINALVPKGAIIAFKIEPPFCGIFTYLIL
jgi:hypothetical protein